MEGGRGEGYGKSSKRVGSGQIENYAKHAFKYIVR